MQFNHSNNIKISIKEELTSSRELWVSKSSSTTSHSSMNVFISVDTAISNYAQKTRNASARLNTYGTWKSVQ